MFAAGVTAALLLLCGSTLAAPPVQSNMNHICLLVPSGLSVASGMDCTSYYVCSNGLASLQSCTPGFNFDKDTQQCLPQTVNNCIVVSNTTTGSNAPNPCNGQPIGTWVPVTGSCGGYYYCGPNGVAQRGNCPLWDNFNYQEQRCSLSSVLPCTETNTPGGSGDSIDGNDDNGNGTAVSNVNLCAYVPNGIYFASPSACSGWNLCTNNVMSSGACPSGYMFNTQSESCDFATNTTCSQVTNDPELSGNATWGGSCGTLGLLKAAYTCAGYYQCDGSNYNLMSCVNGQYFDTVSLTCVNRLQARNNCDRCAGTTAQFVNSYSNSACTGYLYCQNGVEQAVGTCPSGAYFSETAEACVMGIQPLIGCCNPAAFATIPTPDSDPAPPTVGATWA